MILTTEQANAWNVLMRDNIEMGFGISLQITKTVQVCVTRELDGVVKVYRYKHNGTSVLREREPYENREAFAKAYGLQS